MIDLTSALFEQEPDFDHPGFLALRLQRQMRRLYKAMRRRDRRATRRARKLHAPR
jgi:hypothetical protein